MVNKSKIIVCYHKESDKYENDCLLPLHVGKANHPEILQNMVGDNTGDNISHKNSSYCELTGLYWLWKNIEADNYGLFHYRRFLDIRNKYNSQIYSSKLNVIDFDNTAVNTEISKYDMILPKKLKFKMSVYEQYKKAHFIKDLNIVIDIIKSKYPYYITAMEKALNSSGGGVFLQYVYNEKRYI